MPHILQGDAAPSVSNADKLNGQCPSAAPELNHCTSGNAENWMVLSISGDKPTPRFNVNHYSLSVLCGFYELLHLIGSGFIKRSFTISLNSMQQL